MMMKPFALTLAVAILPLLMPTPAEATGVASSSVAPNRAENATPPTTKKEDRFSKRFQTMDRNGDGVVSNEEWTAYHAEQAKTRFDKLDTNRDGKLSADEFAAGRKDRSKKADPASRGNTPRP